MYKITPPAVYATDRVYSDPNAVRRMEAMVAAFGNPEVTDITDDDVPDLIRRHDLSNARQKTKLIGEGIDPIVVFNALKLDNEDEDVGDILARCPDGTPQALARRLLGHDCVAHTTNPMRNGELVCRNVYEFHTTEGCVHRCLYCPCAGEGAVNMALNIEEFIEKKLDPIVRGNDWQRVFRYQTQAADSFCFEPEYGAIKTFVEHFAGMEDRYLLFHTKSANTDFMCDFDHGGHTIALWSLTSDTVSRDIEMRTGTTAERIEAARKCEEAGYQVRFKFKPIIPVRNWREEAREMIRHMFEATTPDVISMCTLMWMTIDELEAAIDPDLLDPDFVHAAREQADDMAQTKAGPFPHHVRAEIYGFYFDEICKHDKDVPVSLSTERMEMWREFEGRLGFGPGNYVCACGPQCTPGLKVLTRDVLTEEAAV